MTANDAASPVCVCFRDPRDVPAELEAGAPPGDPRGLRGHLHKKLEPDPSNPRYLVTEPWVGYRFNPTG